MRQNLQSYQPYALVALRIAMGLVIFSFGTAKVLGFHPGRFVVPTGSLEWYAGIIELTFGFLFLIGFQTRVAAFILSGEMAVAYFLVHMPTSFFPTENGGYASAVYAFVFLYFVAAGAGPLSVDGELEARNG